MSQKKLSEKFEELLNFIEGSSVSESKQTSDEKENFYLTTAINYTNGKPHIGHAYEAVTSDIICRYHRIYGRNVFFLTGTDEHGIKIATTAKSQGKTPRQLCDENVEWFKELNNKLLISNDYFIRTTDKKHLDLAQKMFQKAYDNGDIYFGKYEGWFNIREERYVPEAEAEKNKHIDPVTKKPLIWDTEDAYYFKMSKYQDALLKHIKNNKNFILPENAYNHILSRLEEKLDDLCVSRSKFSWGVPLPETLPHAKNHVMYVWFDALTNYLSGIEYLDPDSSLRHFWPVNAHIIGRDIDWFHSVIWPCILMSCGVPLPQSVFCHGFVTDDNGEKMSKSLGNVVDPFDMLNEFDVDSIRYFIATQAPFGQDMRWNVNDLKNKHDAHLTHGFGNLVNRTLKLTVLFCDSKIPDVEVEKIFDLKKLQNEFELHFSKYALLEASNSIMDRIRECNNYLVAKEPWKMEEYSLIQQTVIRTVLESIYVIAHFMTPFIPRACKQLFEDLNTPSTYITSLNDNFQNLKIGTKIKIGDLLFKQIDSRFQKKIKNGNK